MKNMEPSQHYGSEFGQDIEPKGTYVLEKDFDGPLSPPWVAGVAELSNPLRINVTDDTLISYKQDLVNQYKAKGKVLTNKLMKAGYDAIICVLPSGHSGEIILFPNAKFTLDKIQENTTKTLIKKLLHESLLLENPLERYHYDGAKIPVGKIFFHDNMHADGYNQIDRLFSKVYKDDDSFEQNPIERVNVRDIVPTQKFVGADNLKKVKNKFGEDTGAYLLKHGGLYYVIDGHHRIANRIIDGNDTITAYVVEI